MTAAPIDIPLDERGAPDLQRLVRKLGEAAAKERGEAYDPALRCSRRLVASVEVRPRRSIVPVLKKVSVELLTIALSLELRR